MKFAVKAALAAAALFAIIPREPANAMNVGVPTAIYAGPECFLFGLVAGQDYSYAVPNTAANQGKIALILERAAKNQTVTVVEKDDIPLPLRNIFPDMVPCYKGDGVSISFWENPVSIF